MLLRSAQWLIAAASLIGLLVSLGLFTATFTSRSFLEDTMAEFVRARVKQEVRERLGTAVGNGPEELKGWFDERGETMADFLDEDFDRVVDGVIDSLCGIDCEESRRDYLDTLKEAYRTASSSDTRGTATSLT